VRSRWLRACRKASASGWEWLGESDSAAVAVELCEGPVPLRGAGEGEVWDKQVDLVPHDPEVREAADHLGDVVADGAEVDGEGLGQVRGRGNSAGVPKVAEVEIWEDGLGVGPVEESVVGSCVS
jgi:hypothetical protein